MSEIYNAEGQKGLDREVIRMLYEYAELRGSHKSLDRYRYAKDAPAARAIYQRRRKSPRGRDSPSDAHLQT